MAKSKNENNDNIKKELGCLLLISIGIALITIFSIVIQLIPLAIPTIILFVFIGALFRYIGKDGKNIKRKFLLTNNEQNEFEKLGRSLVQAYDKLEESYRTIETKNLHKNKDGRLSQRSYEGVAVQGAIDNANQTIKENSGRYHTLRNQPITQWKAARKHYAKFLGGMFAIIVWLFMVFGSTTNTVHSFGQYVQHIGCTAYSGTAMICDLWKGVLNSKSQKDKGLEHNFPQKTKSEMAFTDALWKAMFFMTIVYFIAWTIGFFLFWIKNHKPEESKHSQQLRQVSIVS